MSYNAVAIASILKVPLGLDSWDFKLDYDTIKVQFHVFINEIIKG